MPTNAEFQELLGNCTSEWTIVNGVEGRRFTSKKNGNSIFMPATGERGRDRLYDAGYVGSYWSSSVDAFFAFDAYIMRTDSRSSSSSSDARYVGAAIRPVSE